ncbi:sugar ABC transporter substrate-binding protein [Acidisoma cellulosilytica]|uniref:Sugar ABC transporter substrate-binding protein n=1 Tax=Acidisoma cellulosilyticum TaxID=2802395 RepID=A0A964E4Y7_9PROT|nr:sugar ABC transporter substrate-binding protein [Acidisoma cellulosilyticum]MCB8882135.1 sugar ABC transporter substrate-binding protein [Acidisoma cellulosilyticum]
MKRRSLLAAGLGGAAALGWPRPGRSQSKPFDGMVLHLASVNDQYSPGLKALSARFKQETGITVLVDILGYGELQTKITTDYVGHTKGYDLATTDNVWAPQFAEAGYTVPLNDWMKRDAEAMKLDDIYPVLFTALGNYKGKQVAFPLAGYANVLAYRKDLYATARLQPPQTMQDLVANAYKLTDKSRNQYGWVANGQKGAACAQDWMQYLAEIGGVLVAKDQPTLDAPLNIQSLQTYKDLFQKAAPPGAVNWDWDGREASFRSGLAANMQTWSVGALGYFDPAQSKVTDSAALMVTPTAAGMKPRYGIGGWGIAINADIEDQRKQAAWTYIKWITSPEIHIALNQLNACSFLRRSELQDASLNRKYPFLPVIDESFTHGDADFRPRVPQYPEIQDILGTAVNSALVGAMTPAAALAAAQTQALRYF